MHLFKEFYRVALKKGSFVLGGIIGLGFTVFCLGLFGFYKTILEMEEEGGRFLKKQDRASFASDFFSSFCGEAPLPEGGIVVLTGGKARVAQALDLLLCQYGRNPLRARLLVSGVHPLTTAAQIAHQTGHSAPLFACCVDLDHEALDTSGNAQSIALWTGQHGYSALIVVTSSYHMPRALLELSAAMPGVILHPATVSWKVPKNGLERLSSQELKLLVREYLKYLLVWCRLHLWGGFSASVAHGYVTSW